MAKFNKLIFLDSDVVLPSNYVYEMYIRLCLIPNAVLISFKECLDPSNPELENQNIIKGIRKPSNFQCDWRLIVISMKLKRDLGKSTKAILGI